MKDVNKLVIRKTLFAGKLALGLVLCVLIVKTALIGRAQTGFAPAEALGTEVVYEPAMFSLPSLSVADYTRIVELNPFSSSARYRSRVDSDFSRSISKQLGLELLGTVSGGPAVARAVIKDTKTGSIDLYRIGQAVSEAMIFGIETEQIVLLYHGERKILKIETSASVNDEGYELNLVRRHESEHQVPAVKTESRDDAVDVYKTKLGRIETILRKAEIRPYVVEGEIVGLQLAGLDKIDAAKEFGLRDGDVIEVINGQRLTSKQKAYQVFMKARNQPVINIELLRGESPRKVLFDLR
jgi:type II secretory pathway component PulC